MLAFVERYVGDIRQARSDEDIVNILSDIADELGFRSAYLIEYASEIKSALHILDTNPSRAGWWGHYVASGLRTETTEVAKVLGRGGVQRATVARFARDDDPLLTFASDVDMVDCTLVPISYDGILRGRGAGRRAAERAATGRL